MLKQNEKSVRSEFQFLVVISMNSSLYAHSDNSHDFFFYSYSRWPYYLVKPVEWKNSEFRFRYTWVVFDISEGRTHDNSKKKYQAHMLTIVSTTRVSEW